MYKKFKPVTSFFIRFYVNYPNVNYVICGTIFNIALHSVEIIMF